MYRDQCFSLNQLKYMNREIFRNMSSWTQLFFLLLFTFFLLFAFSALIFLFGTNNQSLLTSASFLRLSVCLQSIFIFLVPALLCAYLFEKKPLSYLKINKPIDIRFLILSIILIIAVQPLVSWLGYYNSTLSLPASLAPLEQQMKEWEDMATKTMEQLLLNSSVSVLLLNIFVIAIIAGITEEFFFRGSVQQLITKISSNKHVAIWITAFIFSAIHFQFYGFFPRMFLGALLGYLFVWSGNLWIPVIVHSMNNAMSVLLFHFYYGTSTYDKIESIGVGDTWWTSLISLVITALVCYLLIKDFSHNKIEDYD